MVSCGQKRTASVAGFLFSRSCTRNTGQQELVFHQGAELSVGALSAVVSSQGDDESRNLAEPVTYLLLHPGLLPAPGAEGYLLGLTKYSASLLLEARRCPHDSDTCIQQAGVVFVVDPAGVGKDLGLEPFPHLWDWSQTDTKVGKPGQLKQ